MTSPKHLYIVTVNWHSCCVYSTPVSPICLISSIRKATSLYENTRSWISI